MILGVGWIVVGVWGLCFRCIMIFVVRWGLGIRNCARVMFRVFISNCVRVILGVSIFILSLIDTHSLWFSTQSFVSEPIPHHFFIVYYSVISTVIVSITPAIFALP